MEKSSDKKMHIKEFAALVGVSVRTLRYYDEIGLLKPALVDSSTSYRFYDSDSLERMQEILFYRELDFPLKSILAILSSPDYDKQRALGEQKRLLMLKRERLDRLIAALENAEKGRHTDMKAFDNSEYEQARREYAEEAERRWGGTNTYAESQSKTVSYTQDDWSDIDLAMSAIFSEFAGLASAGADASNSAAQSAVRKWQQHITDSFYHCTKEILAGLGQMYIADERFKRNIDRHGNGTAEFMAEAIRIYCE